MNRIYKFNLERGWGNTFPAPNTIFRYLDKDFNIDTQLYTIFFEEVGLPVKEKTDVVFVLGQDSKYHELNEPVN